MMSTLEQNKTSSAATPPSDKIPPSTPKKAPAGKTGSEILSFIRTLLIIVIAAGFLRATVIEAFKIPSASMKPTLLVGDRIFVWKFAYGLRLPFVRKTPWQYAEPKRGDVVVFTREDDPATDEDESDPNIIKRVIGVPGDTVEVRGTRLFVNQQLQEELYARYEDGGIREGNFGPEQVPPGHIFLLGDNRDRSRDSRFWENSHYLPIENVKGKAFIIYWSWEDFGRIGSVIH